MEHRIKVLDRDIVRLACVEFKFVRGFIATFDVMPVVSASFLQSLAVVARTEEVFAVAMRWGFSVHDLERRVNPRSILFCLKRRLPSR